MKPGERKAKYIICSYNGHHIYDLDDHGRLPPNTFPKNRPRKLFLDLQIQRVQEINRQCTAHMYAQHPMMFCSTQPICYQSNIDPSSPTVSAVTNPQSTSPVQASDINEISEEDSNLDLFLPASNEFDSEVYETLFPQDLDDDVNDTFETNFFQGFLI